MVSVTSLTWVTADAMQIRRFLMVYAGCFIFAWYGTLMTCCAYGWGYEQVGLLRGAFPRTLSSTDQHQTAISNMLLFIVKDCIAHVLAPGCCTNIKGQYFKYWLLQGGGDRTSCGTPQALPGPEQSTTGLGVLAQAFPFRGRDDEDGVDDIEEGIDRPSGCASRDSAVGSVKV